jgi:lipid A oxidase
LTAFNLGSLFSIFLFSLVCIPTPARADWIFGGYMGASGTSSNSLTVTPTAGSGFTLDDVAYKGEAFRSPWYYGVRVSYVGPPDVTALSPEIEWTHAKAIAEIDPRSSDLNAFQQSHGLNFLLGNLAYRLAVSCGGRCTPVVRGGLGISTPHVETTFRNVHQEQYQRGGFAWQLGAGIEFHLWQFIYGVGDARITRVTEKHLRAAGAEVSGSFFTRHFDIGVSLRLPGR